MNKTDILIIGAGPVGLFTVFEAGLLGLNCTLIDNLDKPGGQCAELYPDKPIYDIPSRISITGQELTNDLLAQAKPFKPVYHLNQQVEKISKIDSNEWLVETTLNKSIKAKCIVIAAGAGSFVSRKLPLENINHLHSVANALLEFESISGIEMEKIIKGEKIVKLEDKDSNSSSRPSRRRSAKNKTQDNT